MRVKRASVFLALTLLTLVSLPLSADIREILTFRDVEIPWTLRHGDIVMEKGSYDVILIKHGIEIFCLKIRQNGKSICIIKNPERIKYANQDNLYEMMQDPEVSSESILRMKKNEALNTVYFLIETGDCQGCRFQKFRFKAQSVET